MSPWGMAVPTGPTVLSQQTWEPGAHPAAQRVKAHQEVAGPWALSHGPDSCPKALNQCPGHNQETPRGGVPQPGDPWGRGVRLAGGDQSGSCLETGRRSPLLPAYLGLGTLGWQGYSPTCRMPDHEPTPRVVPSHGAGRPLAVPTVQRGGEGRRSRRLAGRGPATSSLSQPIEQ